MRKHRDPDDVFSFADFDFIHAPGGHAPMVDFHKNPWLGEALHLARENQVYISLICHAPIALTSTNFRINENEEPYPVRDNPFWAAEVTTVSTTGETGMLDYGYVNIPGELTRLEYFVDEGLREAGFNVVAATVPTSLFLLPNPARTRDRQRPPDGRYPGRRHSRQSYKMTCLRQPSMGASGTSP